ncbi:MAG: sialidase family protein [Candidatus Latescibacterota bacterium]|nr:sialidase family protein [Candidatus Latescibacterota bacterium]
MEHTIILREEGRYNAFPILDRLPDGRLTLACISSSVGDHMGMGNWPVFVSADSGRTWTRSDDPTLPPNWPGTTPREKHDRLCRIMPNGRFVAVGSVGYELWDPGRRDEAEARGLQIYEGDIINQQFPGKLIVSGHQLVAIRSRDHGQTWDRRTWTVPGYTGLVGFPRGTVLANGTWLFPIYARRPDSGVDGLIFRSTDVGETWRLHLAVPRVCNEWALVEVTPGKVLGHIRHGYRWGHPEDDRIYALEIWSEDGGKTWTQPIETRFQGYPNHLLKLRDGRILCTFGYRRKPMGVRALISEDQGNTWDLDHEYVLRDDAGTTSNAWPPEKDTPEGFGSSDVGYPVSVELDDGSILTAYYTTPADATTHVALTHWHPDRDRP